MAIQIYYESGKDATYTDITAYYRTNSLAIAEGAEEGNVEQSTIQFDDPDGTLDFIGWRRMYVFETSGAVGYKLIFGGWVGGRTIGRIGPDAAEYLGAGRVWTVTLLDQNAILHMRMMTADAKRGTESDVTFVTWLMTHPSMSRIINTDRLYADDPVTMSPDRDYLGQKGVEALTDAANQSGKNFFAYVHENGATPFLVEPAIWYGAYGLAQWSSDIQISNDPADIDSTDCFAPSTDTTLDRSPERVFSGGYGQYDGGAVYRERAATHVEFTRRDTPIPMHNVKTAAIARARVDRELADIASEEDVITTSIVVPAASVNRLRAGMRVEYKATHMPGYEDAFVWMRVLRREVRQENFRYRVTVTLAKPTQGTTTALCTGLTSTGSFYPLGGSGNVPNESGGNVLYLRPGIEYPQAVTVDHQGSWHFPEYGAGGAATVDYAGDCGQNIVRCLVVGDGTIEVNTATYSGSARNLVARLIHADSGAPSGYVIDETQYQATATTFTFEVSTHGGLACTHWVDVTDTGSTCGGKWGFSGFDWTAA